MPEFLWLCKPDKHLSLALQQLSPWFSHYNPSNSTKSTSPCFYIGGIVAVHLSKMAATMIGTSIWAASSEFVSSSIPSWKILTAHAQPFRGARDLAFCLKVPLDSLLVWASSGGSSDTAQDCANAQARLNLRCSHKRVWDCQSCIKKTQHVSMFYMQIHLQHACFLTSAFAWPFFIHHFFSPTKPKTPNIILHLHTLLNKFSFRSYIGLDAIQ